MQCIYFISDIHLGAASEEIEAEKTQKLLAFLNETIEKADALYILGDLYDFWFEYRNAIPKIDIRVLAKLRELVCEGVEVHYFVGNHDCWHEEYLAEQTGVKIYYEPHTILHNSLKLFIAHGDGLLHNDWASRMRTRIFKSRINIALYRLLPPDLAIPFARWVAAKSRQTGDNPFDAEYRQFAEQKFRDGFDAVILGHTHKPLFEKIGPKYYINLGEWGKQYKTLRLNGPDFEMQTWPATNSKAPKQGKLTNPSKV